MQPVYNSSSAGLSVPAWKPNGAPFCWQPKEAMRLIEQGVDQPAPAMLIYLALARIASDLGQSSFSKPINYIAKLACVGRRTVERRLSDLEKVGVIKVERGALRTCHHYTLATFSRNDAPACRNDATGNDAAAVALTREIEKERRRPLSTADRIGLEKQLEILEARLATLKGETAEHWQRQINPELVREKEEVKKRIAEIQNQLLAV